MQITHDEELRVAALDDVQRATEAVCEALDNWDLVLPLALCREIAVAVLKTVKCIS